MSVHCFVYGMTFVVRQLILAGSLSAVALPSDDPGPESQLRYRLQEEVPRGTRVGSIIDDAALRDQYNATTLRNIRFRFLADSNDLFDVAETTGVITTAVEIDRDSAALCRQRDLCELSIDVVLQPSQFFRIVKVVVELLDINDNSPQFREPHTYLPIVEAAQVGSVYIIPTASDADSPRYGIKSYEIDTQSPKFGLRIIEKIDGMLEVKLVLNERLDRESESQYQLKLMAYDGGETPRIGTSTITITVLDSNDNRPRFTAQQYEVSVLENVPVGAVILRVQASDPDAGPNGLVEYGFTQQTQLMLGQVFGIRNNTGEIFVRSNIDHERTPIHQLVVVARDHGPEPFSSEATVVVHVEDLNDNAPSVTINTLSSTAWGSHTAPVAEVLENVTLGTFVAHVSVVDSDAGDNGRVNCTLNENAFRLVRKFATEYQIVTAAALDRERVEQYTVTLKCQDGATISRVTEKTLRVVIGDVNDSPPVFGQTFYNGSVIENNYIGASVLQVSAVDRDEGENARIQYLIPDQSKSSGLFHVDQRGVISAHSVIDREKYIGFRFTVLAVDMGSPSRTGSALVAITIEDVNDERPKFQQQSYIFSVAENDPAGTKVGTVVADDLDGPLFNVVVYGFQSPAAVDGVFSLNPSTGTISTLQPLDRETQGLHRFVIVAFDPKVRQMSSTASVSVNVLDKNDNSPVFHFPTRSNDTVFISNLLPVGHVVTEVAVADADIENNQKLSFRLVGERNDRGMFRIDPNRGAVLVNAKLSSLDYQTFRLTVMASDHGSPPRSQTAELKIHVNRTIAFGSGAHNARLSYWNSTYTLVLVIVIVASGFVIVTILVVAVFLLREREKRRRRRKQNCSRMEALRMLTTKDAQVCCSSSPEVSPAKKMTNGGQQMRLPVGLNGNLADNAVSAGVVGGRGSLQSVTEENTENNFRVWSSAAASGGQKDAPQVLPSQQPRSRGCGGSDRTSDYSFNGSATDSEIGHQPHHPLQMGDEQEEEEDEDEEEEEEEEEDEDDGGQSNHHPHPRERHLPPPPPPPRGSFWLQQQQQQHLQMKPPHHQQQRRGHNHPTVRFKELNSTEDEDLGGGVGATGEDPRHPSSSHRQRLIGRLTSSSSAGAPTARAVRLHRTADDALGYSNDATRLLHQERSTTGNTLSSSSGELPMTSSSSPGERQTTQRVMTSSYSGVDHPMTQGHVVTSSSLSRNPSARASLPFAAADDGSSTLTRHRNGGASGKFCSRADDNPAAATTTTTTTATTTTTTGLIDDDDIMLKEVTV